MRIISPNAELLPNTDEPYKMIEKAGRICYKSEEKSSEDSSKRFVKMLINNKHTAMLEHAWIHFSCSSYLTYNLLDIIPIEYLKYIVIDDGLISGSFRAFVELLDNCKNYAYSDLKLLSKLLIKVYPEVFDKFKDDYSLTEACRILKNTNGTYTLTGNEFDDITIYTSRQLQDYYPYKHNLYRHLPHTIKFICDRGVTHEFVRHRPASFAQESTRYCNYSNGKFNNEITVIKPIFYDEHSENYNTWKKSCEFCEKSYMELINNGSTPQEARSVLPNSLKTELIITATEEEWQHIINLRLKGTTGVPHPQMMEVMTIAGAILSKVSDKRIG